MSTAIELVDKLPKDSNVREWKPAEKAYMEQLGLINRKTWKGPQPDAPAGVIEAFLMQCRRTQLDPGARQIYAAEMGGKWTVLISIDGFRLIADRTGLYRGKKETLWCGPDGVWKDVWLSDEPPAAAKVAVMREGFSEPLVAVATYAGYCPRDNKTKALKPSGQWETNPSNQLAKCAEMLALRQAFPNDLSGLYGTEEMDQARTAQREAKAQHDARQAPQTLTVQEQPSVQQEAPKYTAEDVARWFDLAASASTVDELGAIWAEAQRAGGLHESVDGRVLRTLLRDLKATFEAAPVEVVDAEVVGEPVTEWATVQPGEGGQA